MTLVMLMAGGENTRWLGVGPKEVAPIAGEPVIARTVRLCRAWDVEPTVISHKPEVLAAVASTPVYTERAPYILDAAWRLRGRWQKRTVILYADVVYTEAALEAILFCPEPLWWFGHGPEMFAHVWRPNRDTDVRILEALRDAYSDSLGKIRGKTWNLYWRRWNMQAGDYRANKLYTDLDDATMDIDTLEAHAEARRRFEQVPL